MLIAPIIFTTIVVGIAHMGAMKDVGRIGLRAFIYFEVVSTLALVIGLVVVNVLKPGVGLKVIATPADVQAAAATARKRGRRTTPSRFCSTSSRRRWWTRSRAATSSRSCWSPR